MPPRMGPTMTPTLKVMGSKRNARDWYLQLGSASQLTCTRLEPRWGCVYFFSRIVSLILYRHVSKLFSVKVRNVMTYIVLRTPTLPLVMPPIERKKRACQNDVEKAKPTQESTTLEYQIWHPPDTPACLETHWCLQGQLTRRFFVQSN
jgi:hypothetical protein